MIEPLVSTNPDFRRITGATRLPAGLRGGVVAIGNFDGIHRGHQAVLGTAIDEARAEGRPALVLTFEPHPRAFFRPDVPLYRITPAPVKAMLLAALGFDAVIEQEFDHAFAGLSADAFVASVLGERLGIARAVAGFDFHFGKGRQGGPAFLIDAGHRAGFRVTLVDAYRDENAEVVSSSRIRACLARGELAEANGLLGYRLTVAGTVIRGRQLGRTLGFPTANIRLPEDTALCHGIYAVRLRRADGSLHDGVASFGRRPTVEAAGEPLLEVFLFDFDGDLYDEQCTVSLFSWLRGEERFADLAALKEQMHRDAAEAGSVLAAARPLGALDRTIAFAGGTG